MTLTAEVFYLVLAVLAAAGGIYWRWGGLIGKVRDDLAAHKLHVAEVYATKAGMHEQTAQIMEAIKTVGERIEGVNQRLDRLYEPKPVRRAG
ncbi:hypothetical protein [Allomesorhizobium camelthorni]|uniref:Uncharacterized protein n=1 Tax=Allomesorhizobium camelthorni TaxID=475069 RepID=A0A6G4WBT5_9HYPH|nr:hypothetical protein [Mesorhizobium camelthorni]NGO51600.1 hypothetical protein [Mesorhizobium camelthorni]